MSKFFLITKINLLQSINYHNNSKYKSERRKKALKGLLIGIIIIYILFYVYFIANSLMPSFVLINKPLYLLAFLFSICSLYIFFANLFKIKNILFDFKDYDLLISLPIKRSTIIISKMISLYITNLLYTLIIMIPGYIAYIKYASLPNHFLFFLLLLAIPIVPILASSVIGIIVSWLTSFFKNKKIGSYIIYLLIIVLVFFGTYKINGLDEMTIVNNSINIVDSFNKYYPLTNIYIALLESFNLTSLLAFIIVPLGLFSLFIIFINKGYLLLRDKLLKQNIKSDYILKIFFSPLGTIIPINKPIISLYKKEIKRYISSPLYVINTAFGCIFVILLILSILLFNDNVISRFERITSFNEVIKNNIFMILPMICVVSSTTNSSISLEGKSLWIMKMLPVSANNIFMSKIMVNLTILIPTIIIASTFFGLYLHLPFIEFLFLYLIMFVYSLFAAINGIIINLMFPKLDFENEIRVIKQSMSVFLSILVGVIVVVLPFNILIININSIILITSIIFLLDVILVIVLYYYGNRKFIRL